MKLFRKISDNVKWAGYEEHSAWSNEDCPGEMLIELYDSRGISVWDVGEGEKERILRLCAVLCFGMATVPEQYCGIVFDSSLVKSSMLQLKKSPSSQICKTISESHYDIGGVTTRRFATFAKSVLNEGEVIVFKREQIIDRMATLQNNNELSSGQLPGKYADLFSFLWKRSRLSLTMSTSEH